MHSLCMTDTRAAYLKNAEEAEVNAAKTTDPYLRSQFLKVAEQWRRLAGRTAGGAGRDDGAT